MQNRHPTCAEPHERSIDTFYMQIVSFVSLLAGAILLPVAVAGAQDATVAHQGDIARVTIATFPADSLLEGRLAWISADSVSVWRRGAATMLPLAALRSVEVRRRPRGYTKRTVATAVVAGAIGGVLGARLGACRAGAPPGGLVSCDTPDPLTSVFAVLGTVLGASTGWLVQALREPTRWVPARIVPR